jgi:WD40 repeat protein
MIHTLSLLLAAQFVGPSGPVQTFREYKRLNEAICRKLSVQLPKANSKSQVVTTAQVDSRDNYGDDLPAGALRLLGTIRLRHPDLIDQILFSPDGRLVASLGRDNSIRVWELGTGRQVGEIVASETSISSMAFGPSSTVLYYAASDRTIRLWDVYTRDEILLKDNCNGSIQDLKCSADGRTLVWIEDGVAVQTWDLHTRRESGGIQPDPNNTRGPGEYARLVELSSDGALLAAANPHAGAVDIWDVRKAKTIVRLATANGRASSLSISARLVALGHTDGTLRLWEIASGRELRQMKASPSGIYCIAFSSDGKTIAAGGDSTIAFGTRAPAGKLTR